MVAPNTPPLKGPPCPHCKAKATGKIGCSPLASCMVCGTIIGHKGFQVPTWAKAHEDLLDAICTALPFVEDCLNLPEYKTLSVLKAIATIKAAIAKREAK